MAGLKVKKVASANPDKVKVSYSTKKELLLLSVYLTGKLTVSLIHNCQVNSLVFNDS